MRLPSAPPGSGSRSRNALSAFQPVRDAQNPSCFVGFTSVLMVALQNAASHLDGDALCRPDLEIHPRHQQPTLADLER